MVREGRDLAEIVDLAMVGGEVIARHAETDAAKDTEHIARALLVLPPRIRG
jgi:hypothetical protein